MAGDRRQTAFNKTYNESYKIHFIRFGEIPGDSAGRDWRARLITVLLQKMPVTRNYMSADLSGDLGFEF